MAIVRLLLFTALAIIVIALALYVVKRDRRYLRFVGQVAKFLGITLLAILLWFAVERLFGPFPGVFSPTSGIKPARGSPFVATASTRA